MAELKRYTPTLREKITAGISGLLGDNRKSYRSAEKVSDILDLTPIGAATAAYDAGRLGAIGAEQGSAGDILGATALMATAGLPVPARKAAKKGIRAFHGTPHDFDKFEMGKIGTGEGAQAYGHGLYFAEREGTAKSYRDALTSGTRFDNPTFNALGGEAKFIDPEDARTISQGGREAALSRLRVVDDEIRGLQDMRTSMPPQQRASIDESLPHYQSEKAELNRLIEADNFSGGRMYEVNIDADPADFLDWDKPVSEHPEKIRSALGWTPERLDEFAKTEDVLDRNLLADLGVGGHPKASIEDINAASLRANELVEEVGFTPGTLGSEVLPKLPIKRGPGGSRREADYLRGAGISGIKYLDQGSRNAGGWHITPPDQTTSGKWMVKGSDYNSKGLQFDTEAEAQQALAEKTEEQTRNFVLFRDDIVEIVKKYGIAGAAALTGLSQSDVAEAAQQQEGRVSGLIP